MASAALRGPVAHDDRLSLVDHLDELRSRLIVCVIAVIVAFGVCLWQNGTLLSVVNHPLDRETQKSIQKGQGPLGEISVTQKSLRDVAMADRELAATLAQPGSGLSPSARAAMRDRVAELDAALARLPDTIEGNKPVTLGIGEPFATTLLVSFMFALLLAMPVVLYQAYAFVVPAFTPEERRVAIPLLSLVPLLFAAGVAFGYFLVLPAAVRFLQNFNADEFNVLVQARDYYKFVALTLLATGIVFQIPVGILALTRLGVISVQTLRRNRRYAIVIIAVIAMLLPGTDPVSMLIMMGPLVVLFELSILLAAVFAPKGDATDDAQEEPEPDAV
ncbi:MAG TPA: twin-arginine translocase subunit TatC [Capillimicrobium sp.]|nr:twin-arginine translocase subunit TatC [Capillimicrobium sp.]